MAESIFEWYSNASGRDSDDVGHDWENDELLERTQDAWLQDHPPQTTTPASSAPAPWPVVAVTQPTAKRSERPPHVPARLGEREELNLAVRIIRKAGPGITVERIVQRLRRCGWSEITEVRVRAAIEDVRTHQRRPDDAGGDLSLEELQVAVRVVHDIFPQLSSGELAGRLRRYGWPLVSRHEVRVALATVDPRAVPPGGFQLRPSPPFPRSGDTQGRTSKGKPAGTHRRRRETQPPQPVGVCPSCRMVRSLVGTCLCS